jgi:hypothetical protein
MRRLVRTRKLFRFLREHRDRIFTDEFQAELEGMYRTSGAGKPPLPPAQLAMATLLQGYVGASDAEAVELAIVDLRWQLVLDCLGATEPLFSQGALHDFRHRMIRHDMDRRLLERTVVVARETGAFDPKKLPKTLRVAIDSAPLEGAGRVEDTINLLGHAARKVAECAAELLEWPLERFCAEAGIPILLCSSIKRGLDVDWSDPAEKHEALQVLLGQLDALVTFVGKQLPAELGQPPLHEPVETLRQLVEQDIEPDPSGGRRVRRGVASERRVSVTDPEMRHGRKSKARLFNGFKRHIATDLDDNLILACAVTPANRPEEEATPELADDLAEQGYGFDSLYIDRAYINSDLVDGLTGIGGQVYCRPWTARNTKGKKLFSKAAFRINMRDRTITCPAGQVQGFLPDSLVEFDPDICAPCPRRCECTMAPFSSGRTVSIAANERLQHRLRKLVATRKGREYLRQRVPIEHSLAHLVRRQGKRARYRGVRANLYDVRRAAAIQNLEGIQRKVAA